METVMIYRVAEYNWNASEIIRLVTDEEKEKLLEELGTLPDDIYTEIPEGWTDVEPPSVPSWKLFFDWETNEWIETAEWYEKEGYESEEEAYAHKAELHMQEMAREQEEKRVEAEKQLINLVAEQFILSEELTENQKEKFLDVFPLWKPSQELEVDDKVVYEGNVYRVVQKHTSQLDWLPSEVPALYAVFYQRTAEDEDGNEVEVIPDWVQPTGSQDAYNTGDKVMFEGKAYESVVDDNVWSPGVHGWEEVVM